MQTIAVTIQKGGAGKTTTALMTAELLAQYGDAILIDLDTQANSTFCANIENYDTDIIDILTNKEPITNCVYESPKGYDVVPNSETNAGNIEDVLTNLNNSRLNEEMEFLAQHYDYCVIDTPPSLDALTINALFAADYVVVPAQPDKVHTDAIRQIMETITAVQRTNNGLQVAGVLLTRFNKHTRIHRYMVDVIKDLTQELDIRLFDSYIRNSIVASELQLYEKPLYKQNRKAKILKDYKSYIDELLEVMKGGK